MVMNWLTISWILWLYQKCDKYKTVVKGSVRLSLPSNSQASDMQMFVYA